MTGTTFAIALLSSALTIQINKTDNSAEYKKVLLGLFIPALVLYFLLLVIELILNFLLIQQVRKQAASMVNFQNQNGNYKMDSIKTDLSRTASPLIKLKNHFCNTKNASIDDFPVIATVDSTKYDLETSAVDLTDATVRSTDKIQNRLKIDVSEIPVVVSAKHISNDTGQEQKKHQHLLKIPAPNEICKRDDKTLIINIPEMPSSVTPIATLVDSKIDNDSDMELAEQALKVEPSVVLGNTLKVADNNKGNHQERSVKEKVKSTFNLFNFKPFNNNCGKVNNSVESIITSADTLSTNQGSPPTTTTQVYQEKATKTILLISFVQILSTLPLVAAFAKTIYLLETDRFLERIEIMHYTINWLRMPIILNSILNSIVYVSRNKKILTLYKKIFYNIRRKFKINS